MHRARAVVALAAIALVLTVWSGLLYVRDAVRLAREHRAQG